MWPFFYTKKSKPAESRGTSLANPAGIAQLLGYSLSGTSVAVTDKTVLGLSPAWAAIRLLSETVASMDLGVYSWDESNEGYKSNYGHPLNALISSRPHPHYSKFDFLQALVANACLGNGYARIHRDADFRPYALELLPPSSVTQEIDDRGELYYIVQGVIGQKVVNLRLLPYEIIHIKGVTFNGLTGERITLVHRENISSSLAAQKYADTYFNKGAHLSGVISTDMTLDKEQRENAKDAFRDAYSGMENVGKTAILDSGLKYTRIGSTPQEAALIDFRNLSVEESSRIFKVPVHMLSGMHRATFNNIEQQSLEFRQYGLPTWTEKIEQEFNYKLFTTKEFARRRAFSMFDYTQIQMADTTATAALISAGVQNGIFTANEFRKRFKLPQDPDGNRLYIQKNMTPVDRVDDEIDKQISGDGQTDNTKDGDAQGTQTGG